MHPIKNHRIVRQGAAMAASARDRCGVAIESAENEGWPLERPYPVATRQVSKDAVAAFPVFQSTVMRAGE
jgi:hypothetical protein